LLHVLYVALSSPSATSRIDGVTGEVVMLDVATAASSLSLLLLLCCVVILLLYVATGTFVDRLQARPRYVQSCNRWLSLFGVQWKTDAERERESAAGGVRRRRDDGSSLWQLAWHSWRLLLLGVRPEAEGLVVEELPKEPSPEVPLRRRSQRSQSGSPASQQLSPQLTPSSSAASTPRGLVTPVFGNTLHLPMSASTPTTPTKASPVGGWSVGGDSFSSSASSSSFSARGGGRGEITLQLTPLAEEREPASSDSSAPTTLPIPPTVSIASAVAAAAALAEAAHTLSPAQTPSPQPTRLSAPPPPPLDVSSTLSPPETSSPQLVLPPSASIAAPAEPVVITAAPASSAVPSEPTEAELSPDDKDHLQLPRQLSGVRLTRSHSNPVLAAAELAVRAASSFVRAHTPTRHAGSPRIFGDGRPPLPSPDSKSSGGLAASAHTPSMDTRVLTPTDARFLHSSIFSPDMGPEQDAGLRPRRSRSSIGLAQRARAGSDVSSGGWSPRAAAAAVAAAAGSLSPSFKAAASRWAGHVSGNVTPMETEAQASLLPADELPPPPRDERERMLQQIARQAQAQEEAAREAEEIEQAAAAAAAAAAAVEAAASSSPSDAPGAAAVEGEPAVAAAAAEQAVSLSIGPDVVPVAAAVELAPPPSVTAVPPEAQSSSSASAQAELPAAATTADAKDPPPQTEE
jgi:hypothetical protein